MNIPESEYIERCALEDLHAAADEIDKASAGLESMVLDSSFVSIASNLPASAIVINRTLGLGLGLETSEEEVEAIVSAYNAQNIERYFVQVSPHHQPETTENWLAAHGLSQGRGWQKFSRNRSVVEPRQSKLSVKEIHSDPDLAFGRIVCNAFDIGDEGVSWLSKLPARPDWHIFMSFHGDTPAGVGALYVKDGLGWTDFGATAPEFRRMGSQSALMSARLECALDLGCQQIFTCTGVSVPGDPQHSYSNILKAGFKESYVRENYVPG